MYQLARVGISVAPLLVAIFIGIGLQQDVRSSLAAESWSTATGTVFDSQVSSPFSWFGRSAWVGYSYTVGGEKYESYRVAFASPRISRSFFSSESLYPVGRAVDVRYDPHNPSEAALQVGWRIGFTYQAAVVVGLVAVSLTLWLRLA